MKREGMSWARLTVMRTAATWQWLQGSDRTKHAILRWTESQGFRRYGSLIRADRHMYSSKRLSGRYSKQ